MRKILSSITLLLLALCLFAMAGCGAKINWKQSDVTLKDWGEVVSSSNGGFVAETKNYFYVINGVGNSTADNTFGAPVKGALVAVSKADLIAGKSADEIEKCIVVPKLFVASDYSSGLYIDGDYVYYGTPTTDKDSSGKAASSVLEFMRTKLDGTDTTVFFKVSALTDEYRFAKVDGVVYIVAYDSEKEQLISFNTSSKTSAVIADKDETTDSMETLDSYTFASTEDANDCTVVFTKKVFSEKYNEDASKSQDYARATEKFNKVYAYRPGADAKCVIDGSQTNATYAVSAKNGNFLFYTETKVVSVNTAKTFGIRFKDIYSGAKATEIVNTDYATADNLIVSLSKVFVANGTTLRQTTLIGNKAEEEKTVANIKDGAISKFITCDGDYVYYINSSNYLARTKVNNIDDSVEEDSYMQVLSDGVVNTSWYLPEKVGDFFVYSDNSASGCTYTKFVNVNNDMEAKYDDNDKVEGYAMKGQVQVCVLDTADYGNIASGYVDKVTEKLEDGKIVVEESEKDLTSARNFYEKLDKKAKKEFNASKLELLKKYEYAVKLSKAFEKLDGFDKLSDTEKTAKKADYENAKKVVDEICATDIKIDSVRSYVDTNANYFYNLADKFFAE